MTPERRQEIEREIVSAVVDGLLAQGMELSVWNGGDQPEVKRTQNREKIVKGLFQCDVESLMLYKPGNTSIGHVDLVYGNGGFDVVADYAGPSMVDQVIESLQPLVDKYEKEAA